jgi:hypothetical protein
LVAENTALQYIDREISYRELDELSNQLANALTSLGVSKDDVVGIQMPNIPQYPIALVAISKLGCTGSGVSPLLMPGEIVHQIEDAGITTLISFDALANSVLTQLPGIPACLENVIVAGAADYLAPAEVGIPDLAGVNCSSYLSVVDKASTVFEARPADWNDTWPVYGWHYGRAEGRRDLGQKHHVQHVSDLGVLAVGDRQGSTGDGLPDVPCGGSGHNGVSFTARRPDIADSRPARHRVFLQADDALSADTAGSRAHALPDVAGESVVRRYRLLESGSRNYRCRTTDGHGPRAHRSGHRRK